MRGLVTILVLCFSVATVFASERPVCRNVDGEMGWVMPSGRFRPDKNCAEKDVVCAAVGTRAEGWYSLEGIPMYDNQNGEPLRCDSDYGRELLTVTYRYFCKDEYVYESHYDLLEYHLNCQFPKAE